MINRFTNIFWYYIRGPLLGCWQHLWPKEAEFHRQWKIIAIAAYGTLITVFMLANLSTLTRIGLALILFSPQWLYVTPRPHPVFEFRGYGMAAGIAILLAEVLESHLWLMLALSVFWAWRSYVRRSILIDPLRFWKKVQEDNLNGT